MAYFLFVILVVILAVILVSSWCFLIPSLSARCQHPGVILVFRAFDFFFLALPPKMRVHLKQDRTRALPPTLPGPWQVIAIILAVLVRTIIFNLLASSWHHPCRCQAPSHRIILVILV